MRDRLALDACALALEHGRGLRDLIGAGLEAQVGLGKFGLSLASPRKLLYEKKGQTHDPGCPQT